MKIIKLTKAIVRRHQPPSGVHFSALDLDYLEWHGPWKRICGGLVILVKLRHWHWGSRKFPSWVFQKIGLVKQLDIELYYLDLSVLLLYWSDGDWSPSHKVPWLSGYEWLSRKCQSSKKYSNKIHGGFWHDMIWYAEIISKHRIIL